MINKNLISICIANYNKWPYIKECLDSIKKYENIDNLEIVVIDDKSTDNSKSEILNWKNNNKDIKVIFEENIINSWPWITYNNAIKIANWEYITFMDSDDFFIKSTLNNKREILKNNLNLNLIYWNWTFFENLKFNWNLHSIIFKLFKKYNYNPEKILDNIYCKVPLLSLSTALIKKEFLSNIWGFDEKCLSNDWILNIKIFKNLVNDKNFKIDENLAFWYRIHNNNISKDYDKILLMLKQVIEKYCPNELINIWLSNIYFTNSLSNLSIWKYEKWINSIKKSLKYKFEIKKLILFIFALLFSKMINLLPNNLINIIKQYILKYFQ